MPKGAGLQEDVGLGGKKKKGRAAGKGGRPAVGKSGPVSTEVPVGSAGFLADLKKRIARERVRAVLAANSAMVMLYWEIGKSILVSQEKEGWGTKVVDRLSLDLKLAFPQMTGLGARNLMFMRQFAAAWPDLAIVKRCVSQLPWGSNVVLLQRLDEPALRLWYAAKATQLGWSRDLLVVQIKSRLHERVGQAQHNFQATLPPVDSDMAEQAFKDPYLLDFLGSAELRREAELGECTASGATDPPDDKTPWANPSPRWIATLAEQGADPHRGLSRHDAPLTSHFWASPPKPRSESFRNANRLPGTYHLRYLPGLLS